MPYLDLRLRPVKTEAVRSRQLGGAGQRRLAVPAGPAHDPHAWRSQHERRVRAAIAAARAARGRS